MTDDNKFKFWIEVEDGAGGTNVVEWCNLTKRTAKIMYSQTLTYCRTDSVKRYGWEEQ